MNKRLDHISNTQFLAFNDFKGALFEIDSNGNLRRKLIFESGLLKEARWHFTESINFKQRLVKSVFETKYRLASEIVIRTKNFK